jgi:two-component system, NtrC family, C4-dicarboxylate transport sensor histidine kinase DctB
MIAPASETPPPADAATASPPTTLPPWLRRLLRLLPYLFMLLLVLGSAMGSYRASQQIGYRQLDDSALLELDLYGYTLESELGRYAYLPDLLEVDSDIQAVMRSPPHPVLEDAASKKLARFSVTAGAMEMWVLGPQGELLASSHAYRSMPSRQWRDPAWLMAQVRGPGVQRFFAADPDTGAPSYFFLHPVEHGGARLGVIAMRISLDPLEATWADLSIRSESEEVFVVDDNGVIVMSSVAAWRYRTLEAPTSEQLQRLKDSARYPNQTLQPLGLTLLQTIERGVRLVRVPTEPTRSSNVLRATQDRPMATLGWRLIILSNPAEMLRNAAFVALGSGALVAFFCLLSIYLRQRRRTLKQLFAARHALQQVNDGLAATVAERTHTLELTNTQLMQKMQEHHLAQQELLQAGKLAVLGQMSVGIAHEISQPLTALRALSNNTKVLLQQGRTQEAMNNLSALGDLVARMGRITTQLKSFARRAPDRSAAGMPTASPVPLQVAIANVCLLLEHRTRTETVEVRIDVPADMQVRCDQHRLEQVLINLASNALDAMKDCETRTLRFNAETKDGRVWVRVIDTGPPVSDEVLQHLFEPFFSTKATGEGLGLGLVISSSIAREFGGTLRVARAESGLVFEFDVPLATADED